MWSLIGAAELERYLDENRDFYLVDIRDRDSFLQEHIRGAVNIPAEEFWCQEFSKRESLKREFPDCEASKRESPDREFLAGSRKLPWDRLIVLYCYHGPQSMRIAGKLARCGYDVADVYGGIQAYRAYRGKYLVSNEANRRKPEAET